MGLVSEWRRHLGFQRLMSRVSRRVRSFYAEHETRMARYLAGSVLATALSAVTYAATFGPALLGSRGASLAASAVGALANYQLNRRWTWQRTGRGSLREHVPYWLTIVVTALIAAMVTGLVNGMVRVHVDSRGVRTLINMTTFVAVYGVSFVGKYAIFGWVFGRAHATDRQRSSSERDDGERPAA